MISRPMDARDVHTNDRLLYRRYSSPLPCQPSFHEYVVTYHLYPSITPLSQSGPLTLSRAPSSIRCMRKHTQVWVAAEVFPENDFSSTLGWLAWSGISSRDTSSRPFPTSLGSVGLLQIILSSTSCSDTFPVLA